MSRPFRVRVSSALAEAFTADLERSGYGPRQKGVWIGEALQQLERDDPQLHRCGIGDDLDVPRQISLGITLARDDFARLQELVLRIRQGSPSSRVSERSWSVLPSAIESALLLLAKPLSSYPRYPHHNWMFFDVGDV